MESCVFEFRFHQPGQREIEIVAAEQQMLADRGAGELDAIAIAMDPDQSEVAGAAADVADQHELAVEQAFLRLRQVIRDPGIKRRGRLFHQRELFDSGFARGLNGEFAGLFIERRGNSKDDVLRGQRRVGMRLIPGVADMRQNRPWKLRPARARGRLPARPREESCAVRSTSGFESQDLAE